MSVSNTAMARDVASHSSRPSRNVLWPIAALLLAFLVGWPLYAPNPFLLTIGTFIVLNAIGATSLHLIIRTGHISLGHAAFMGVGAYSCVLAVTKFGLPPALGLLVGMAASALLALLIGPVVLRLTGKYFVLVTFLLGEIIRMVFVEWISVTGGSNGISGVPPLHPSLASPTATYYVCLAASVLCVALCARILSSEVGRTIDSVRESERVAECSGVPVIRLKVTIFVLACALVGLQGGLLAFFLRYVDPTSFSMVESLNLVVMNVVGGMYSLAGPLIGTLFIVALPELLRGYVELQRVFFGIILIVVMAALPGGMVDIFARVRKLVAGKRNEAAR
jgi:branched-chain amino acid transport system permease protein